MQKNAFSMYAEILRNDAISEIYFQMIQQDRQVDRGNMANVNC